MIKKLLFKYLKQPSTWKGIIGLATALGVALSPALVAAIVPVGIGIIGVIEIVINEKKEN